MKATVELDDLKKDIRKIIQDTLQEEMIKLRADLVQFISVEEQQEISKLYSSPTRHVGKSVKADI